MAGETFARYKNTLEAEEMMILKRVQFPRDIFIKGSQVLRDCAPVELPPCVDIFGNLDLCGARVKN